MSEAATRGTVGYRAALGGAAVAERPDRAHVRVMGREPVGMLQGILTNSVPAASAAPEGGVVRGRGSYSAVLTPKGRMVTDLRVVRGPLAGDGLLLDLPAAALPGLLAHLGQYLPPRFAKVVDETARISALTVAGPGAGALLTREALGLRVEEAELASLPEEGWVWVEAGGPGVLAVRSGDLSVPSYDVIAERGTVDALRARLIEAGASPLEDADREVLRVEAGRPAWGAELDEATLPPEAGIDRRAIDHNKGCYTGQEVIVRIRDRGHVNRQLRGLKLGGGALPARGAELWAAGDRPVGSVTSAVRSARADGVIALGYLRREVEVPGVVRLGSPDGPSVAVTTLDAEWWRG